MIIIFEQFTTISCDKILVCGENVSQDVKIFSDRHVKNVKHSRKMS